MFISNRKMTYEKEGKIITLQKGSEVTKDMWDDNTWNVLIRDNDISEKTDKSLVFDEPIEESNRQDELTKYLNLQDKSVKKLKGKKSK